MIIKTVTAKFAVKIPTQPFGNIELTLEATAELNLFEETLEAVSQELFRKLEEQVTIAVRPIAEAKIRQTKKIIESLPEELRVTAQGQWGTIEYIEMMFEALKKGE